MSARADVPTVQPGVDVLQGSALCRKRIRKAMTTGGLLSGSAWDDNEAPGGHNGCDTRNDIPQPRSRRQDLCRNQAMSGCGGSGTLHDPYTNATIAFVRGNQVGASVQIDHA